MKLSGFVTQHAPESSTRLAGLLLTLATIVFAFAHPAETASIAALGSSAAAMFFSRKRAGESAPSTP